MIFRRISHDIESTSARTLPLWIILFAVLCCGGQRLNAQPPAESGRGGLEGEVATIFTTHCAHAGCHSGPDPQRGMNLARDRFYSNIVGRASTERPTLQLAAPGHADSSYLVMKLRGAPGIVGRRMPLGGGPLSNEQIATIARWIDSLGGVDRERIAREPSAGRGVVRPFGGWKLGDLPTTRMLGEGNFLFLITHHFAPELTDADAFFGLDGSANILFSISYAPIDNMILTLARSNVTDDIEMQGRYRIVAQRVDGFPLAATLIATANVITEEQPASTGSHVHISAQLPISHQIIDELGAEIVPGVLFNPALDLEGESPMITLGIGGQWHFYRNFSLFAEWMPIISGYTTTTTFGFKNLYDSWASGVDIAMGGHIFQIYVTNTLGTATDQYLRGGDLDITQGELRLGFNIFRILEF